MRLLSRKVIKVPRTHGQALKVTCLLGDGQFNKWACNAHKRGKPKTPPRILKYKPIGLCQKEEYVCLNVEWNACFVKLRTHFYQCCQRSAQKKWPPCTSSTNYVPFMQYER